jgi:iron complex outermembrane receptor protein
VRGWPTGTSIRALAAWLIALAAAMSAIEARVSADGRAQQPSQPAAPPTGQARPGQPEKREEPEEQEPIEIEETVIVTATRTDRRLQDEPVRVEVIGREEIEEKALMTPGSVAMLLGETTGVRVQTTAPSIGAANVRIQGLRGRYSQLLADGLPLYGAAGDSFSLLQVPPLDLGQVEILKGAASALYGSSALGGVINLVSRRPAETATEALVNVTTQTGRDVTMFSGAAPRGGWSWTLLGGYHGQERQDFDRDGWSDLPAYDRGVARPRVFYETGRGASLFATGGFIAEDRSGGTEPGDVAPDGQPFVEALDTRRGDGGLVWRTVSGQRLIAVRGSASRLSQARVFGTATEHTTRDTGFGEASIAGTRGNHTWVVGGAVSLDHLRHRELPAFDYTFVAPGLFVQDDVVLGDAATLAAGLRVDVHSTYGALVSPRVSLLARPASRWTVRVSAGGGAFAPTPFTEETDETGLSRLDPDLDLDAERAVSGSADVSWTEGPVEVTATLFGSRVSHPVQLVNVPEGGVALRNFDEPTETWGTELLFRYRRGSWLAMASHAYTSSREADPETGLRRTVPLTPRHASSFNAMWEDEDVGRVGFECYVIGRQFLEDNPYRTDSAVYALIGVLVERAVGPVRLFVNFENLGDVRQTKYDPLVRPAPLPDGRWTVDAWSPLEGRVINGGLRITF